MKLNVIKATFLVAFLVLCIPLVYLGWKKSEAKIDFKAIEDKKSEDINLQTEEQFNDFLKNIGNTVSEVKPDVLQSQDTNRLAMSIQLLDTLQHYAYAGVLAQKLGEIQKSAFRYSQSARFFLQQTYVKPEPTKDFMFCKKAKQNFEQSLIINPNNNATKIDLALCILTINDMMPPKDQGAMMKPILILREVNSNDSNNVDAIYYLGKLSIRGGKYDNAVKRFKKLVYLQPKNLEYKADLAEAEKLLEASKNK